MRALCDRQAQALRARSTFLAERINPGDEVKVYVQKAQLLRCRGPENADHHDRTGHRHRAVPRLPARPPRHRRAGRTGCSSAISAATCDFFYSDELNAMKTAGLLTRLSLAWSRDGDKKFYVQDRMREVGRELWTWLAEGANVYVCGDAKRMAKDVERALVDIVADAWRSQPDRCDESAQRAEGKRPLSDRRLLGDCQAVIIDRRPAATPPRMAALSRLPVFFALEGKRAVVAGRNRRPRHGRPNCFRRRARKSRSFAPRAERGDAARLPALRRAGAIVDS